MDSIVFKTVLPFIKPYPVLLNFPKSGLYLIISLCNIYLDFPEVVISTIVFTQLLYKSLFNTYFLENCIFSLFQIYNGR